MVLDLIVPINPPSNYGHKWILAATNYFTRWIEVVAFRDATKTLVVEFLDEIVTRFGVPSTIISDNAKSLVGAQIYAWVVDHCIYLSTSSNYYPQGNGLVESSNKKMIRILKRNIEDNQSCWHKKLRTSLWVDR